MKSLILVAVTHTTAPFSVLERVALDAEGCDMLADSLYAVDGVEEAVVLSTCNRTEMYLIADHAAVDRALELLAAQSDVAVHQLRDVAVILDGNEASLHLFRVAAGLESRIVGEGEILRQVRSTAARADVHPAAGPALNALLRWAASTGRRARREAGDHAAPSLARTALDAAGPMDDNALAIVLGAGAMAGAVAAELRARRARYLVAARRPERAALLTRHPQDAIALDRLAHHLRGASLLVCATGARAPIVWANNVRAVRDGDGLQPLTVLDLSMPRNVDPAVADLDGVRLVHLDELSGTGDDLHLRRVHDAVTAAHERYLVWLAGRAVGPVIAALRARVAELCFDEVRRHVDPASAAGIAHALAGKVLHAPTIALKQLSALGELDAIATVAASMGVSAPLEHGPRGRHQVAS